MIYRINVTVMQYRDGQPHYRQKKCIAVDFKRRSEARKSLYREVDRRMEEQMYFVSPRSDYDLVNYRLTRGALIRTYMRLRIVSTEAVKA